MSLASLTHRFVSLPSDDDDDDDSDESSSNGDSAHSSSGEGSADPDDDDHDAADSDDAGGAGGEGQSEADGSADEREHGHQHPGGSADGRKQAEVARALDPASPAPKGAGCASPRRRNMASSLHSTPTKAGHKIWQSPSGGASPGEEDDDGIVRLKSVQQQLDPALLDPTHPLHGLEQAKPGTIAKRTRSKLELNKVDVDDLDFLGSSEVRHRHRRSIRCRPDASVSNQQFTGQNVILRRASRYSNCCCVCLRGVGLSE